MLKCTFNSLAGNGCNSTIWSGTEEGKGKNRIHLLVDVV